MRNSLTIAAAAVILAGCASGGGLHNPFSSSTGFSDLDTNGDGVISRSEARDAPVLASNFNRIDTNRDGVINSAEFTAATTFMSPQPGFSHYDLDGNGFITKQDAKTAGGELVNVFSQVDADHDGNVSTAEFSAATINPLSGLSFSQVDTDNDGAIDRQEAGKFPLLAANFDRIDINGDGQISKSEFNQMKNR